MNKVKKFSMSKLKAMLLKKKKYFYMSENPKYKLKYISIGEHTYGEPEVYYWGENSFLKIGKYCSFAKNTQILLGGTNAIKLRNESKI